MHAGCGGFESCLVHQNSRFSLKFYCDNSRHLVCVPYSVENLHKMAEELGLNKCWFHAGDKPHYDIPKKRVAEIQAKCTVVTSREILSIITGS